MVTIPTPIGLYIQSIELVETETLQLEYIDYHINEIVQFQTG